MTPLVAGGLVFVTSAAVLVLEILAGRLLAPYVGVTLETYTAIIGTVLSGIAVGTWAGGYVADRVEPRHVLGPLLVVGGALSLATVPIARVIGRSVAGPGEGAVLALSMLTFFAPAAVLSAVAPCVVKLQLRDLTVTGRVVGRLSALGTAGAILGTFFAGFVLVDVAPTTTSILFIGGLLVAAGTALWAWLSTASRGTVAAIAMLALVGAGAGAAAGDPCDIETVYHCAQIVVDDARPGGRLLVLDTYRHSYVDLDDATHLDFGYTNVFADVVAALAPAGGLDVLHIGGGGFTMPRYLAAVRPDSVNVVVEIDPGLVELSKQRLGLRTGPGIRVRTGDARMLVPSLAPATQDVVLGDAFAGASVPWHLTTVEFIEAIHSTLRPGGVYAMNIIDRPPLRFARAEMATLRTVFDHVGVIAPWPLVAGDAGGNFVLVASDAPLDAAAIEARITSRHGDERVVVDGEAAAFGRDAPTLTDEHAPIDQWLARARGS